MKVNQSLDSWFYWSQGSDKHFPYLCRRKKRESTWQLKGYRIVLKVIQSNFWINFRTQKRSQPCAYNVLISWIQKDWKQKLVVSYRCRLSIVVEGNSVRMWRGSCFQLTFEYKSYNNCSLFNLGSNIQPLQRVSATLKPSSMRALHSTQLNAKFNKCGHVLWNMIYTDMTYQCGQSGYGAILKLKQKSVYGQSHIWQHKQNMPN